jgi:toxin ParE1/3/4
LTRPSRIAWTKNAIEDLEAIRLYLCEHADADVMRVEAVRIVDSVKRLRQFPDSGRPGRVPMTRELVAPPYVIPYRIAGEVEEILNVFHSSRKR